MADLLQKNLKKDKAIMLTGNFNINLQEHDTNADSTTFLDSMNTKTNRH